MISNKTISIAAVGFASPTLLLSKPNSKPKSNPKTSSVILLTGLKELPMILLTGLRELSLMLLTGLSRPSLMLETGQLELSLMHMTGLVTVLTGKLLVRQFSELPSLVSKETGKVAGTYSPTQACTTEKLTTILKTERRLLSRHKKISKMPWKRKQNIVQPTSQKLANQANQEAITTTLMTSSINLI